MGLCSASACNTGPVRTCWLDRPSPSLAHAVDPSTDVLDLEVFPDPAKSKDTKRCLDPPPAQLHPLQSMTCSARHIRSSTRGPQSRTQLLS